MHSPHRSLHIDKPVACAVPQPREAELAYRGLTVAAMLALLASLWAF
ncbi:MAG TPA: hypothetical protein VKU93_10915 [Terracidiphilus sp.]|nr:hypothetical protein [Terracidiphilus sp.]